MSFTNAKTGEKQECKVALTSDIIRYLGWFTCMDGDIDAAFTQCWEESHEELVKIEKNLWSGHEVETFIKIKTLRRLLYRMGYSSTGEDSIGKFQVQYNKLFRNKSRMIRSFANNLLYAPEKFGGLGWVNFWDEVSIDRICKQLRHANSEGKSASIFEAAERRSATQQESAMQPLESKKKLPWDATMRGRTKERLQQSGVSIRGGSKNCGHRKNDTAILDCDHKTTDIKMVVAGCQQSGIFWKSQMLAETGNTWVTELQHTGKYSSVSAGTYEWTNYRTNTAGGRVAVKHVNKWSVWAEKVKKGMQAHLHQALGQHWKDAKCTLKPMDIVLSAIDQLPKLVIRQVSSNEVEVLETKLSTVARVAPNETNGSKDCTGWQWMDRDLGPGAETKMQKFKYTTIAEPPMTISRANVQKITAQLLPKRVAAKKFRAPLLEDALESFQDAEIGIHGGVFIRFN